jgi:hypothetical protein
MIEKFLNPDEIKLFRKEDKERLDSIIQTMSSGKTAVTMGAARVAGVDPSLVPVFIDVVSSLKEDFSREKIADCTAAVVASAPDALDTYFNVMKKVNDEMLARDLAYDTMRVLEKAPHRLVEYYQTVLDITQKVNRNS